ncbi:MAG: holo-ACP synthase [Gracilibacteraceae bacterium]|jgi:holo-[acyl-carrier protein] synthase|nr:holo-ACP synthase [Gracilibacteraceae bacterium]
MFPGIDLVEVERFARLCERQPAVLTKLFTAAELAELEPRGWESKAARFAGKEAVLKALGTGICGLDWHDVEIRTNEAGEPLVRLSDRAALVAARRGGDTVRLSLTHTQALAGAMAILARQSSGKGEE